MRVLQLSNGYMEKSLYRNLFSHLIPFGVSSDVFVPVKNGYTKKPDESNVKVVECFNSFDRFLFYSKQKKTIKAISKNYKLIDYDLIHAHTLFSTGYSAYKLHLKTGINYMVAVRNTDVNLFFEKFPWFRKIGLRIMQNAKFVVFISVSYRDRVISKYVPKKFQAEIKDKSVVIPNGIDDYFIANPYLESHLIHDPLRIIHVGDIDKNKNLISTIKAIELLIDNGIDVEYTLIGEIKDIEIECEIKSKEYIKYLGKKNKVEIAACLRESDIMVMPSHHETFGLVYGEAMSQGVPVIYTKGQGFDGQFENGSIGYAVDDNDPVDIFESIKKIISIYSTFCSNCIKCFKVFDWNIISKQYAELYGKCLAKEN